jgi:hypothetical protein
MPVSTEEIDEAWNVMGSCFSIAQRGFDTWKNKPHNAKWWRMIDGTPIPNDVVVNIAEAFLEALRKEAALKSKGDQ